MNIRTTSRVAVQDIAYQSAYTYGVNKEMLPPKSPEIPQDVVLPGRGHLETKYQYTNVPSWIGDIPVTFTFMMATRSYEYTNQIYSKMDRTTANTSQNSWLI